MNFWNLVKKWQMCDGLFKIPLYELQPNRMLGGKISDVKLVYSLLEDQWALIY